METEVVPARIAHDIVENIEEIFCNVRRRDVLKEKTKIKQKIEKKPRRKEFVL